MRIPTIIANRKVTQINSEAFSQQERITEIVIPSTVESIGNAAFFNCSGLKKITFEGYSNLNYINGYAFQQCYNLESLTIPSTVTNVSSGILSFGERLTVYTDLERDPYTWDNYWNYSDWISIERPVIWGCELSADKSYVVSFTKTSASITKPNAVNGISAPSREGYVFGGWYKNDDFTGVDAILSVVPYYNKPSQEGIYQHYKAIAEATELPIVLYNVPGRTGVNMTAETTLRIARDFNNVIAIKEASGNITQMDDIIKNKPENFNVISGDDGITFPLITLGAVGVISVIGNAFPREFSRMTRLALQGDFANALTIHHKFTELFNLLFVDGNPAGVKSMLNAMGMIENKLRLPLVPTRITTFEAIRKVLNELNIKC